MAEIDTVNEPALDEKIRAAFARPAGENALVPLPGPSSLTVTDSIITAQKVAVERDEAKVLQKIKVFAQAAGEEWYYRYPVRNNRTNQTDWIEGPSIKCANNVARYYGNCQVDTRVVDNGDSWIVYARFVDYETGFSYTRPFQQRKGQGSIKSKDTDRQLDIALQIGVSKAIRNVICNALETFTNYGFDEAKSAIVGKIGKNVDHYRARVIERLQGLRVDQRRVEATLGRAAQDWLAPDLARIIAQLQAINDGMATIEETWPGETPPRPSRDQFAEQARQAIPDKPPEEDKKVAQTEEPEPFEIVTLDGEVFACPPDRAIEGFKQTLTDAHQRAGLQGLEGVWQSNEAFLTAVGDRIDLETGVALAQFYNDRREILIAKETKEKAAPRGPEAPQGGTSTQQPAQPYQAAERPAAAAAQINPGTAGQAEGSAQVGHSGGASQTQEGARPTQGRTDAASAATAPAHTAGAHAPMEEAGQSSPDGHGQTAPTSASPSERAPAHTPPPRSEFWAQESYTIERPLKQNQSVNFQVLRDILMQHAHHAASVEDIDKLKADNESHLHSLGDAYPKYREQVEAIFRTSREKLAEAR